MTCNKNHQYLLDYNKLPDSQADTEGDRHKCAGCAYVLGMQDGLSNQHQKKVLPASIPYSQAGTIRHKDAMTAYDGGYAEGQRLSS